MAGFLRAGVGRLVRRLVGVAICMAVKAGHADAWLRRTAVVGLVELLLRKWRHQKTPALELLWIDDSVEDFEEVVTGDELSLRNVAEVRALIEVYRRREFGQEVIGDVVVDVKAREIAPFLSLDFIDLEARKHHTAFLIFRVRDRVEAFRGKILVANLLGSHVGDMLPRRPCRKLDANPFLHWLRAVHRDARGGPITQVVTLVEKSRMLPFDLGLLSRQPGHEGGEWLRHCQRQLVARRATWALL